MTDLLGGQLEVVFSNFPVSITHVKAGQLRALAIMGLPELQEQATVNGFRLDVRGPSACGS